MEFIFYFSQICVVHSVHHGPVVSEYGASGTTYAPEGVMFDSNGMQVSEVEIIGTLCCVCMHA